MAQSSVHLVLIGEMGAGKTTVGRLLAESLGCPFRDSDSWIESARGMTGAQIAERDGVPVLHRLELSALVSALEEEPPSVVAAAASVADTAEGRRALSSAAVVWLGADEPVLASRRSSGVHRRRQSEGERDRRRAERHRLWLEVAALRVNTNDLESGEVVEMILDWIDGSDSTTAT